ncbi:unnamed protein product [Sphagnum troendelagicum]
MSCCSRSSKSINHFAAPTSSAADTFDVMLFIFSFAAAANSALNTPSNAQDHKQLSAVVVLIYLMSYCQAGIYLSHGK